MNRIRVLCFLLLLVVASACAPSTPKGDSLWDIAELTGNITEVKVMIDYNGNPSGRNKAKRITDADEIAGFVLSFQNAYMGKQVDDIYGNSTVIRFINEENKYYDFVFSSGKDHEYYSTYHCHDVSFTKKNPWSLYSDSKANEIIVDVNYNEIE